jgi:hypothetical protein
MTDGVIYMTWGMNAINQAENSITTLRRKAGSDYPVMVVGDAEAQAYFADKKHVRFELIEVNPFNEQKSRGFSFMAGRIKPLLAGLSPFERTLYVDADTAFKQSPKIGFDLLDRFDVVVAETETRSLVEGIAGVKESRGTSAWLGTPHILYHNSGMIFWRKNAKTNKLFELWASEWKVYAGWDEQVALLRALLKSEVTYLTVPHTWNCYSEKESHILHHWFGGGQARINGKRRSGALQPARETRKMVKIEIRPGRFVRCYEGDEEKVKKFHNNLMEGRPF